MYLCQMPNCDYVCENKSQINFHHIVPRSKGGKNNQSNLIELCPNCHAKVYVPGMEYGSHSIKHNNSVILHSKLFSTGGYLICYQYAYSDEVEYSMIKLN